MRIISRVTIHLSGKKIDAGNRIQLFGASLYTWMLDLALWFEPRLAVTRVYPFRPNPLPGLVVIGLLICGLTFVGSQVIDGVQAVLPHREEGQP